MYILYIRPLKMKRLYPKYVVVQNKKSCFILLHTIFLLYNYMDYGQPKYNILKDKY